jgi:hypothetical protein
VSRANDPLERIARAAEQSVGDDVRATTFVRGLVLGALVGAAIAGSTIWQRRHNQATEAASAADPSEMSDAGTIRGDASP